MASRIVAALRAIVGTMTGVLVLPFRVVARLLGLSRKGQPKMPKRGNHKQVA
jgi:hypothetical protein